VSFVEHSVQLWYKGRDNFVVGFCGFGSVARAISGTLCYGPIPILDCHRLRCLSLNHQRYLHRCEHVVCL
jgi:hypothetical protein